MGICVAPKHRELIRLSGLGYLQDHEEVRCVYTPTNSELPYNLSTRQPLLPRSCELSWMYVWDTKINPGLFLQYSKVETAVKSQSIHLQETKRQRLRSLWQKVIQKVRVSQWLSLFFSKPFLSRMNVKPWSVKAWVLQMRYYIIQTTEMDLCQIQQKSCVPSL